MVLVRCRLIPNAGSTAALIGRIILSHCSFDRLVAMSGYSSDFIIQYCSENHASDCMNRLVRTLSAQHTAFSHSALVCAIWFPFIAMNTHCVSRASWTSSLSSSTLPLPVVSRIVMSPGDSSILAYLHRLRSKMKCIQNQ